MKNIVCAVAWWLLLAAVIFVRDFPWSAPQKVVPEVHVAVSTPEVKPKKEGSHESRGFVRPEFEEFPELADNIRAQMTLWLDRSDAMEADPTVTKMKLVRNPTSYSWQPTPPKSLIARGKKYMSPPMPHMPYAEK